MAGKKKPDREKETPARRAGDVDSSDDAIAALREINVQPLQVTEELRPVAQGEEMLVVLRDPEGWAAQPSVLTPAAYALASLFNGVRNPKQIQQEFSAQFGQPVTLAEIRHLAEELDRAHFLLSPRFKESVRQRLRRYLGSDSRPMSQVGSSYPQKPEEALTMFEGFFQSTDAPGALPAKHSSSDRVKALMLPHIELSIGAATYAHGYKALLEDTQADLFVIFGVAHQVGDEGLYHVSTKNHQTPFGTVKTQREIAAKLQEAGVSNPEIAEFVHRSEHSIEFQAVLLHALLGQKAGREFEILPILTGPIEPFVEAEDGPVAKHSPCNHDEFKRFVDLLGNELDKSGRKWCAIASVDLSHVGPKFQHNSGITERLLLPVERWDRQMLGHLERLDGDAFYAHIYRDRNARNVDGTIALLTMLQLNKPRLQQGKVLDYSQWLEEGTKSAVTFAAMRFE